jgi:hypothetical protein
MKLSEIPKAQRLKLQKKYLVFHRSFVKEMIARTGAMPNEQLLICRQQFAKKHNIEL